MDQKLDLIAKPAEPQPVATVHDDPFKLLEDLENEDTTPPAKPTEPKPGTIQEPQWDQMTAKDIVNFTLQVVSAQIAQPLNDRISQAFDRVELVRASNEIDKITSAVNPDGTPKYPDFWDYKKEIFTLGSQNPKLTIKQAYLLAKEQNPKKAAAPKKKEGEEEPKPKPKETSPTVFGHRPTQSVGGTKPNPGATVRSAAEAAYATVLEGAPE